MISILIPNEHIDEYTKLSELDQRWMKYSTPHKNHHKNFPLRNDTIADPTIFDNVTFSVNRQFQTLV